MDLLNKFRLTKMLHDQVDISGDDISAVLKAWSEKDYKSLCDYVSQCRDVVPKYVAMLARLTGLSPSSVVHEIVGAKALVKSRRGRPPSGEPVGSAFIPEDETERSQYLNSIVADQKRFM